MNATSASQDGAVTEQDGHVWTVVEAAQGEEYPIGVHSSLQEAVDWCGRHRPDIFTAYAPAMLPSIGIRGPNGNLIGRNEQPQPSSDVAHGIYAYESLIARSTEIDDSHQLRYEIIKLANLIHDYRLVFIDIFKELDIALKNMPLARAHITQLAKCMRERDSVGLETEEWNTRYKRRK